MDIGFFFLGVLVYQSVLLPDGTPDVHLRAAPGGQKLRDIMLDNDIELYGPYVSNLTKCITEFSYAFVVKRCICVFQARPLLNCGGVGTCGTCIVEVTP